MEENGPGDYGRTDKALLERKVLQESRRPVCRWCWMGEWDLRGSLPCKLEAHKPRGCRSGKGAVRGRQEGQGRPEETMETKFPSSFGILESWNVGKKSEGLKCVVFDLVFIFKVPSASFQTLAGCRQMGGARAEVGRWKAGGLDLRGTFPFSSSHLIVFSSEACFVGSGG